MVVVLLLQSCIPLSIAPKIDTDKIKIGKKFKRSLPNQYVYIFEDPKNANEFYHFINAKFDLNFDLVDANVPFIVNKSEYALSFYEIEKVDRSINLLPLAIDAALTAEDGPPIFDALYTSRNGHWYLALTVIDQDLNDCLAPGYHKRDVLVRYLRALREEYLTTTDYRVANLRNQLSKP